MNSLPSCVEAVMQLFVKPRRPAADLVSLVRDDLPDGVVGVLGGVFARPRDGDALVADVVGIDARI